MGKIVTHDSGCQLSLVFEPGLSNRHRSLRECVAAGVYAIGLGRVASQVDEAPSHLSEKLAGGTGDRNRDVGCDLLERYLDKTGDKTPIYYLIDKYLRDRSAQHDAAMLDLAKLARSLPALLAQAGVKV